MAVTLTGSNGIFTRLGKLFQVAQRIVDHQSGSGSGIYDEVEDVIDEFDSADMHMVQNILDPRAMQQRAGLALYDLQVAARAIVIGMVNDDADLPDDSLETALKELIRQMEASSASVDGSTAIDVVDASNATFDSGNTGNGAMIAAFIAPYHKDVTQNSRGEAGKLQCLLDSQNGDTIAGSELWRLDGEPHIADIADAGWPGSFDTALQLASGGSGAFFRRIIGTNPSENASTAKGQNMLHNSDFEDFTTTHS